MVKNQMLDPKICDADFSNRFVVITGATSGIGQAAVEKFASKGADILTINRSVAKSKSFSESIEKKYHTSCNYLIADFSSIRDIHKVGEYLAKLDRKIDVLIHNAGVFVTQKSITADNLELVFQVNYLSTFILNHYLVDKFVSQNEGRILFVNSEAHRFAAWGLELDDLLWKKRKYSGLKAYGASKLAQLQSVLSFDDRFKKTNVTVNAMHPGNIETNSGQNNGRLYKFFKKQVIDKTARKIDVATEAIYYLCVSPEIEQVSGKFFNLTTLEEPAPPALDRSAADQLWERSKELGGVQ